MFTIGEIAVEPEVADVHFACDLGSCKGACCTLKGGRGAPVTEEEATEIYAAFPVVRKYLPQKHREWIERHGMMEGYTGAFTTRCVDDRACVFVHYEAEIARCSFETAYSKNEINWQKPLSCHLFPLRLSRGIVKEVHYEILEECAPAVRKGNAERTPLRIFLKDVLVRAFGAGWYEQFVAGCAEQSRILNGEH